MSSSGSGGIKEAVCVIIDGNVSMLKRTPSSTTSVTSDRDHGRDRHDGIGNPSSSAPSQISRFDIAKDVAIDFISSLMIRSKTNEYVLSV